jgi:hypothetical protein
MLPAIPNWTGPGQPGGAATLLLRAATEPRHWTAPARRGPPRLPWRQRGFAGVTLPCQVAIIPAGIQEPPTPQRSDNAKPLLGSAETGLTRTGLCGILLALPEHFLHFTNAHSAGDWWQRCEAVSKKVSGAWPVPSLDRTAHTLPLAGSCLLCRQCPVHVSTRCLLW